MNYQEKLDLAVEWLGERWCFHPARRVQRIPPSEQINAHKADVTSTFERVRARIKPSVLIVTNGGGEK